MKRILLTGMSGNGKSTITDELAALGYKAIDADSEAWSHWVNTSGNPTGANAGRDWMWQEDRIRQLLATEDAKILFVSGCAENMGQFLSQFDHTILLSAPAETIIERLSTRTTNSYGKKSEEVAAILANITQIEPLLRQVADHEIDTRSTIEEVIAEVVHIATA